MRAGQALRARRRALGRAWRRLAGSHRRIGLGVVLALVGLGLVVATFPSRHRSPPPASVMPRLAAARPAPQPIHRAEPAQPAAPPAKPAARPVEEAALRPPPARRPLPALPSAPAAEPAWLRFAVPAPAAGSRPLVAIVLDDLGLDRARTAAAIRLPGPLTLSFMTYADDLPGQTEAARRAGHELLLHVPMEALDRRENPGPHALYTSLTRGEILDRLRWGLGRFGGFVGINNHMGSKFTADAAGMAPVIEELRARGLLFLNSRTTARSAGLGLAAADGVPHAGRDVFLDDDLAPAAISRQLALVEEIARRHGSAIAIGHAHDTTLAALAAWLPSLGAKGLVLAPVSAVVHYRIAEKAQAER